ncbi:hypothetical protein [Paenibacillus sp. UASWS1643]|uniref:hypothetical protein n=1 Tax=Paenibacillus sp. UASWS1643 TaxID=2580422 RepID=UPI00123C10B4|nr:hypothetical protein [Paenibacillus sp. UASWS1643]KAA8748205.1 hypothetical protein FE296_19125 [Paenibacillus sp. UASWS1643]
MTRFSVGIFDRLFGKKTTLELTDSKGSVVERIVTEKWLETMKEQEKVSVVKESSVSSISSQEAVGIVIKAVTDDLPLKWAHVQSEIIGYNAIFKEVPEEWAQFEFLLASLGLDLLALYNLYPKEQAIKMHEQVLSLIGQMEEIGENSATAVHDYYLVASDAISKTENPLDYVASFLCHRLDMTEDIGPIALTGIMEGITQFAGKWRWIKQNFTISA